MSMARSTHDARATRRPCWDTVNDEAVGAPARLARVLAAMHFESYLLTLPWRLVSDWPPPYLRGPTREDVARWFPPSQNRQAAIEEWVQRRREERAELNRTLAATDVHFLRFGKRILMIEAYEGTWRTQDGANAGRNLLDLGMWRWSCRYGQAGYRIARIIGIEVPTGPVEPPPLKLGASHA